MYTGKINLGFVCMVTHVEIDILKKFVVIRTVVYSIVKKDTPKFAIILENLKDVNLQLIADIVTRSQQKSLKIMKE